MTPRRLPLVAAVAASLLMRQRDGEAVTVGQQRIADAIPLNDRVQEQQAARAEAYALSRYAELLIDGIVGVGLCTHEFAEYQVQRGLASFDGNQHNEHWKWNRDRLRQCNERELLSIYLHARHAAGRPE